MSIPGHPGRAGERRSILLLCAGLFVFTLQDLVIKLVAGDYPVHQILLIRTLTALPILGWLLRPFGGCRAAFSPRLPVLMLRGLILFLSYALYYVAFPVMKLADIMALWSTVPLMLTALAGLLLRERIGGKRFAAVSVGFLGAIVMLRPGSGLFEWASLLPVGAALAYSIAAVMARRLGVIEPAAVMAFHQNSAFFLCSALIATAVTVLGAPEVHHPSLAFASREWAMPSLRDFVLIAACGPIAALGTMLLTTAYRDAPAAKIAPFEYTALIWAVLWGYLLWSEIPGTASLIGGALIVGAGLYLLASTPSNERDAQPAGGAA